MYGQNEVAKIDQRVDGALNVNSIWPTLQGEGPDAGRPAVFVRLAKCNLRCFFCDTEFEKGAMMTAEAVAEAATQYTMGTPEPLAVITGGEPLLQNIIPLVKHLNSVLISVAVETAGTVWLPGLEECFMPDRSIFGNVIVCSPKTKRIDPRLANVIGAYKYIVKAGQTGEDGLPVTSTQMLDRYDPIQRPLAARHPDGHLTRCPVYLQAMDEGLESHTSANLKEAARLCMKHGYRLSVQTHKLAGVP